MVVDGRDLQIRLVESKRLSLGRKSAKFAVTLAAAILQSPSPTVNH